MKIVHVWRTSNLGEGGENEVDIETDTFWQASDTTIAALHLFHNLDSDPSGNSLGPTMKKTLDPLNLGLGHNFFSLGTLR